MVKEINPSEITVFLKQNHYGLLTVRELNTQLKIRIEQYRIQEEAFAERIIFYNRNRRIQVSLKDVRSVCLSTRLDSALITVSYRTNAHTELKFMS